MGKRGGMSKTEWEMGVKGKAGAAKTIRPLVGSPGEISSHSPAFQVRVTGKRAPARIV